MTDAGATIEPNEAWAFCHRILPDVSRTFALNIPVLPARLRNSVCCAYLLCRIADTIEDGERMSAADRAALYDAWRAAVDPRSARRKFPTEWAKDSPAAYARLVAGSADVLAAFASLEAGEREAIAACVREMTEGMQGLAGQARLERTVRFICTEIAGLDEYCHYVAGTVGVMLTRLFAAALVDEAGFATAETVELGRRFGLGLQATNIIKDHVADVARGVCYVPRICVEATRDGWAILPQRRVELIRHALEHMDRAMEYVVRIPHAAEGIRLFCVWAMMLALGTLREAGRGTASPKVPREEVVTIIESSRRIVGDDARLSAGYADYRRQVEGTLKTDRAAPAAAQGTDA